MIAISNAARQIPQNNNLGSSGLSEFSDAAVNIEVGEKM